MDFSFDPIENFSYGTILVAPSPALSGTEITLQSGEGDLFPDPGSIGYNITIYPENTGPLFSNAEIVRVTALVGDVMTIVRAQEATTAKPVDVGWQVAMAPTRKAMVDIQDAINFPSGVTPGSYTRANITVDEQGRITAAADGAASGTVTSVSLVAANGFSGSVANPTTTPAITITTSVTGILYGDGTGVAAAIAANFPTLNQNTTGSAASLTTPRNINGVAFNGTVDITVAAAAGTLTGATLASNVTASSLLSAAGGSFGTAAFTNSTAYEVPLTFSTGLTRSTNTITVNSSQVIAKLTNLTSNGFVKTSSGDGTLLIDTNSYITGNQTITLSGDATGSGTTAITVAVVKINGVLMSGLATGILKNTTTTGAPSIAVAADFPTLNQNTTGSAATLTTPRAIYGNNFDGSIALTQIIASTFGGTGNGFTKFTGPATAEKTFTLPNSSETLLYAGGALGTPSSGTVTNLTGTASININGSVGATTPDTGAFTTLSTNGAGLTLIGSATTGQLFFGSNSNQILNFATNNLQFLSGGTHNGTSFTARATTFSRVRCASNVTISVDSGLTIGNTFSPTDIVTINGTGLSVVGTLATSAPAGASAGAWKLGSIVTGAVVVDTSRSVFIDIGGSVIKVIVAV